HKLAKEAFIIEQFFCLGSAAFGRLRVEIRLHGIIIVQLHAVKAELSVLANLGRKRHLFARSWPNRIFTCNDVPGPERETVALFSLNRSHLSFLLDLPIRSDTPGVPLQRSPCQRPVFPLALPWVFCESSYDFLSGLRPALDGLEYVFALRA